MTPRVSACSLLIGLWFGGAASFSALAQDAPKSSSDAGRKACPTSIGQRISPTACIEIEPKAAAEELTLENNAALSAEKLRDYCPNAVLVDGVDRKRTRIALPETSFLYDTSDCCPSTELKLKVDARRRRFSISGLGRDCFGGTAHFDVEEFYSLDKARQAKLLRRLDRSGELKPVPE